MLQEHPPEDTFYDDLEELVLIYLSMGADMISYLELRQINELDRLEDGIILNTHKLLHHSKKLDQQIKTILNYLNP